MYKRKWYAFVLAHTYYKELIQAGVSIYEYTPGFVHAKVFVSDDDTATVGTINLDYRSLYLHFECGAYIYDLSLIHIFYKRGRNSKTISPAKNQSVTDYRRATGFEALMGYLYLQRRYERMLELIKMGLDSLDNNEEQS